jgi:hypothetical protein
MELGSAKEQRKNMKLVASSKNGMKKVHMFPFLSYELANKDRSMHGTVFVAFIYGGHVESRR